MTELPAGAAARAHRALESLHALIYFAPEAEQQLTHVGLRPGRMCYFASRAAAMGPVSAGVVTAAFYNFSPQLVARHIPRAWSLASVPHILEARRKAADQALRRLLGDEAPNVPAVAELAELVEAATDGLLPEGRPLFAAHAGLDRPDEAHLRLWHGITLLREYRGDGHLAALLRSGLSGVEALVTHTATGRGFTVAAAKATRGWSDDEWDAATARLAERGVLDRLGSLTPAGVELREAVEADTDRMAAAPWIALGPDRVDRIIEIGKALSREAVANGAFPDGVFATARG